MTVLIAGDIGGTKTILRLVKVSNGGANFTTLAEEKYPSQHYPDLVPIVQTFLAQAKQSVPQRACFAIAGPVINQTSRLTNLNWYLDAKRLQQELNLERVSLINDFAAVSYGILGLDPKNDLRSLQSAPTRRESPIAVIGAGTGLGEGFLVPDDTRYLVFATEGGHADFAPRSQLEFQLLQDIQTRQNLDRVSVERVVSGQGIVAIYQFLRDRQFAPESPHLAQIVKTWEQQQEKTVDAAAAISQAASQGDDRLSLKTMELFIEAYAAEAGNLALKLLPYGGLYLAGGIAAKIYTLIESSRFLEVFKQKGRMSAILAQVPIHIILNPQVGLLGSILYALRD